MNPPKAIDFYFDFSSPYGYLASTQIDAVGERHNRKINWRPYLMGAAFKVTGRTSLVNHPLVGDYARRDLARSARLLNVPISMPDPFPVHSVAACRAYYWLFAQSEDNAKSLAHKLYNAYFVEGRDISKKPIVLDVAESLGLERDVVENSIASPEIKTHLREVTEEAIQRKIFGSPFFIVDGEPFWGHDRLPQLEKWLQESGW